jgi:hypothetical protein
VHHALVQFFLLFGPDFADNQVTFHVQFADGATSALSTRGVYMATFTPVPEPALAVLIGMAMGRLRQRFTAVSTRSIQR